MVRGFVAALVAAGCGVVVAANPVLADSMALPLPMPLPPLETPPRTGPIPIRDFFRTGDVELDMPDYPVGDPRRDPGLVVITDNRHAITTNRNLKNDVATHPAIPDTSGWNFRDVRFRYDPIGDTMFVGINFWNIAGDADNDGDPGRTSPAAAIAGGLDMPNLSGTEAIAIGIDANLNGKVDLLAGVPANKPPGAVDPAFTVAYPLSIAQLNQMGGQLGIENMFGETATLHLGELAYNPSAEHPDFAFSIANFSQIPGLTQTDDAFRFHFRAYAGTGEDLISGEDLFATLVEIEIPRTQIPIPEPAAWLAWSAALLALSATVRRRNPTSRQAKVSR